MPAANPNACSWQEQAFAAARVEMMEMKVLNRGFLVLVVLDTVKKPYRYALAFGSLREYMGHDCSKAFVHGLRKA